jgi:hypothetical protein
VLITYASVRPLNSGVRRGMRRVLPVALLLGLSACLAANPSRPPLASGDYRFQWKDAEFPSGSGFPVKVTISGWHIVVANEHPHREVPIGSLEEGTLLWHSPSTQWIISNDADDAKAESVGGCGDSDPFVVDFKARVIWTCMWGP